jgi:hypothetical protein
MNISIKVTSNGGLGRFERQIPYALSQAINRTMLDVQQAERNALQSKFTLRRKDWMEKSYKIEKFAKKGDPLARLAISPPGAPGKADILSKFEQGGPKLPKGTSIAIPEAAKVNAVGVITTANRPKRLIASGKAWVVRNKATGKGVIRGRVGRGKGAREVVLFGLQPKAVIKPVLRFFETARSVTKGSFTKNLKAALRNAIAGAR